MTIYTRRNSWLLDKHLIGILAKELKKTTSTPLPISKIANRQNLGKSPSSAWLYRLSLTLNYRKLF